MTYTGRIVWIGQTKQVTDKFAIREFVLTDGKDTYPQEVKMQVTQKNCPLLDNYNVGDEITVHINLTSLSIASPTSSSTSVIDAEIGFSIRVGIRICIRRLAISK